MDDIGAPARRHDIADLSLLELKGGRDKGVLPANVGHEVISRERLSLEVAEVVRLGDLPERFSCLRSCKWAFSRALATSTFLSD